MFDAIRKAGVHRFATEMEIGFARMPHRPAADAVAQIEQAGLVGDLGARLGRNQTARRGWGDRCLLVAGALLVNGVDRMIALDWLPPLADPLWDTSAWVDDGHGVGSIMASFLGYRARPSGVLVLCLLSFWAFAVWRMRSGARRA